MDSTQTIMVISMTLNMILFIVILFQMERISHWKSQLVKIAPVSNFYPKLVLYYAVNYTRARSKALRMYGVLWAVYNELRNGHKFDTTDWDHFEVDLVNKEIIKETKDLHEHELPYIDKEWLKQNANEIERTYSDLHANV